MENSGSQRSFGSCSIKNRSCESCSINNHSNICNILTLSPGDQASRADSGVEDKQDFADQDPLPGERSRQQRQAGRAAGADVRLHRADRRGQGDDNDDEDDYDNEYNDYHDNDRLRSSSQWESFLRTKSSVCRG